MQKVREVERKYELPAGAELPSLADLPGITAASGPKSIALEATYFDTADLRLAGRGLTLRRRVGGEDEGWHLKLPVGAEHGVRDEFRAPLGKASRRVPAELADLVRAYSRGARLAPVARIRTTRTRRTLLDESGSVLVEVVADDVSAQSMGESTTVMSWSEVEVELGGGPPELLDAVEHRLAQAGIRRSQASSKVGRLLADRVAVDTTATGRVVGSKRKPPAGAVVTAYLAEQVSALLSCDPLVRRDEPDAVHDMRVATRRIRSTLRTCGRVVDRAATMSLDGELRWLAGVLGEVRDLDVLRQRLTEQVAALPAELVAGPVTARITSHLAQQRAEARDRLLAALKSRRYDALLGALDGLVADPPLTALARRPARRVMRAQVRRAYKRVDRRLAAAAARPPGVERDELAHRARKAAKRARYVAEASAPVAGKPARRFVSAMKKLQDTLGNHQDSVVARQALRELGMQAHLAGENGFTFGLLYGVEEAQATFAAADVERMLDRLRRGKKTRYAR